MQHEQQITICFDVGQLTRLCRVQAQQQRSAGSGWKDELLCVMLGSANSLLWIAVASFCMTAVQPCRWLGTS
jgi:hypothetical protein